MAIFGFFGKDNNNENQPQVDSFGVQNQQQNFAQLNPAQNFAPMQQMIPANMAQQPGNFAYDETRAYQKEIIKEKNEVFRNLQTPNEGTHQPQQIHYAPQMHQPQQPQYIPEHHMHYTPQPQQQNLANEYGQARMYNEVPLKNGYQQVQFNMNQNFQQQYQPQPQYVQKPYQQNHEQYQYNNPPTMPSDYENSFYANQGYQNNSFYENNQYNNQQMQQNAYNQPQQYITSGAYGYNDGYNYAPTPYNNYANYNNDSYGKKYKHARMLEKPMAKEIRSEKFRNIILMFAGIAGIVITSIMLAVFYKAPEGGQFMGIKRESVMYPFPSIFFLMISVACLGWATTDLALLTNGVSKFVHQLNTGNETVPYFITRNYKNMISREVYINWIAFATYIVGAICLGFLYFLQGQYQNSIDRGVSPEVKFFFWTIGTLKSFKTDITINIIVLFAMFAFHIFNIVSTRSRKNNIAGYYNYEPIAANEIKDIKKRANRICLIIMLVIVAIILFAIIIPWLIVRKKQGKSLKPWSTN